MIRRRAFTFAAAFTIASLASLAAAGWVQAEELPRKAITLVVGFAPGGAADSSARIIARKLSENLGQSVLVQNRDGAGGNIAHQYVANAEPDGSVILLGSIGPLAIAPQLMKVGYDPQRDLAPLTMGMAFPDVLVVPASLGVKTLAQYVALARSRPGAIDFASSGTGSATHLAGELFNARAGVDTVHIPYKGGAPAMNDLIAGRVASFYSSPLSALPHIASHKLVALATTGLQRTALMPNVPTVAESGYPGFEAVNWYAFVAPGKTPPAVLDRWNLELVKALESPDVREELTRHGLMPMPGTRAGLASYIAAESRTWGELIKERNIRAQ
ncbi:tripartite tricarboxylate transporter substrate binding protein [soil metagenome]